MTTATDTPVVERGRNITIDEMIGICNGREGHFHDDVVSLKSMRMNADQPGHLLIQRGKNEPIQSIKMEKHIYRQAPNVLYGLPGSYLQKLATGDHADPELAALNFNHWVEENKDREVLLRFQGRGDDQVLRALLSASWNPVPYAQVMQLLKARHGGDQKLHVERFDNKGLAFNLVTKKLDAGGRAVGDVVEWGMRFQDSDVGLETHLKMLPYTETLWCTNGCTTQGRGANVRISHSVRAASDITEVMSQIGQGMGMIAAYSEQVVEQMDNANSIELNEGPELDELFERINKRFDITKLENKYARLGWEAEAKNRPESTVLRFANAYTRAANAEELGYESRFRLQGAGGGILELTVVPSFRWN